MLSTMIRTLYVSRQVLIFFNNLNICWLPLKQNYAKYTQKVNFTYQRFPTDKARRSADLFKTTLDRYSRKKNFIESVER